MKTVKLLVLAATLALAACKAHPPAPTTTINPGPTAESPSPAVANPTPSRVIYPEPEQARPDLSAALRTAAQTHKHVLLDFGGNWCGDCQVLDIYFHNPQNLPVLESNFVLVHINVGHMDENLDIAGQYQVPLDRGVPALAVLSDTGKLLYSQRGGEFAPMRRMESSAVTTFLVQWKPVKTGCSAVTVNC